MFPTDVVIVAGARTPMARYTGVFSEVSAIDLGAHAAKHFVMHLIGHARMLPEAALGSVNSG